MKLAWYYFEYLHDPKMFRLILHNTVTYNYKIVDAKSFDLRLRQVEVDDSRKRNRLSPSRRRLRGRAFTLSPVGPTKGRKSLNISRSRAHFTVRVCLRARRRGRRKNTRRRRVGRARGRAKERVGEVSTFWWLETRRRRRRRRLREERWSGQLRHYIPNRKRDKANKTLSGRRSANRTPWWEEERDRRGEESRGERAGTERTKTWNKSPHFCSLESFSNYGRSGEGGRGRGREEDGGGARREDPLWFIPRQGFGIIKLSGTRKKETWVGTRRERERKSELVL